MQYQFQKLEFTQQLAEQSPIVLHTDNFRKPSLSSTWNIYDILKNKVQNGQSTDDDDDDEYIEIV